MTEGADEASVGCAGNFKSFALPHPAPLRCQSRCFAILWTIAVDIPGDVMPAIAMPRTPHLLLGLTVRLVVPGKVMA